MTVIEKKNIRSVGRYLGGVPANSEFRVCYKLGSDAQSVLTSVGFGNAPSTGMTILPTIKGKVSEFNAEGKYIKLKDLPKEIRIVGEREWSWQDWAGNWHSRVVDIPRECYQRDFISPPSEELTYVEHNGEKYIVSRVFENSTNQHGSIKHTVNLFLELFGKCQLRRGDMDPFIDLKIKKINWHILPPGEYPWNALGEYANCPSSNDLRHVVHV